MNKGEEIFSTAVGSASGIVGAIGGLGCIGLFIAVAIIMSTCLCMAAAVSGSGG